MDYENEKSISDIIRNEFDPKSEQIKTYSLLHSTILPAYNKKHPLPFLSEIFAKNSLILLQNLSAEILPKKRTFGKLFHGGNTVDYFLFRTVSGLLCVRTEIADAHLSLTSRDFFVTALPSNSKSIFNTSVLILLILISILAYLNFLWYRKKIAALKLLEDKNQEILAQKEELQATLNMVEKLNSKLDAQSQALNKSALVAILTPGGEIDFINEKFTLESGYKLSEIARKSFSDLLLPEQKDLFTHMILPAVKNEDVWRGELCLIKSDRAKLWLDAVFVPLLEDHEREYKVYVVQFDITPRIEIEQKLIDKNDNLRDLNQLKNKIFSIVSHDFRSPLKSLLGTLTLFKKGAISSEELKDLSDSLLEKVENTSNFLENILNWSKSQLKGLKIQPQPVSVRTMTHELISLLKPQADNKNIAIENHVPDGLRVHADLEMIKLVMRNLISNALKFSFEENKILIAAEIKNHSAVISIQDFGMGIDLEQKEALFNLESYSTAGTANELGAGLGLILCKEFIEQNNGEIWVESKKGKGSTFKFSLPLAKS